MTLEAPISKKYVEGSNAACTNKSVCISHTSPGNEEMGGFEENEVQNPAQVFFVVVPFKI